MQIPQGVCRNQGYAEGHAGTDAGVEHPVRQYRYDAGLDLDMDDATAGALLAVMRSYTSVVERMPAVVNFNFLPDMGRMTA
ncbi:MAG: hypothetical protein ACREU2_15820 [Steroidobacteraceae bacterium]